MPVLNPNQPTVNVTLPVPQPATMKPKAAAPARPAPQPVPTNPDSGQQAPPQGMAPQQPAALPPPTPTSIIFPWTPADKPKKKLPRKSLRMAKRKYARGEDVVAMIRAVHENPNDSTPRSMLADYLEDNHPYTPKELQVLRTTPHLNIQQTNDPQRPVHLAKLTMADIRTRNQAAGHHWFDRGNARFFGTKIHGAPKHGPGGVYFVTSERSSHYGTQPPLFSVRHFDPETSQVRTAGAFGGHRDIGTALEEAGARAAGLHNKPDQLSRKYAAGDDLSMDFDSMGEDELPKQPLQRPVSAEDITGRTRKQILQQMLEASKRGHYSDTTPREMVQDLETPPDVPQGGGQVWMSDPEDEEPEKFTRLRYAHAELPPGVTIKPSQGDGYKIESPHGYIDYRHNPQEGMNEIWWVESKKKGHGSKLVDMMQSQHPASTIGWGVTTEAGKGLRDKWHAAHPEIEQANGAFEGQFDPSGNNYGEDGEDDDFDDDFDDEDFGDEEGGEPKQYTRLIYPNPEQ